MNVAATSNALAKKPVLETKERQWLELLDRLGKRDLQAFTRVIHARQEERSRRSALGEKVYRSAAKTIGGDSSTTDPVYQHRRDWLQFWIHYYADGSRSTIEAMLGYGKSYVAQCLDKNYQGGRSIGDRAARLIEMRLGRPAKSMDAPFFPFWDTAQSPLTGDLNEEQQDWLELLDGLTDDDMREMTIMVHARRQHNLELMQRYGFFSTPSRPLVQEEAIERDKFENRRAWLRYWIDLYAEGKNTVFAKKVGISSTVPSQYLSLRYAKGRGLSDKAARRIEGALGLHNGAMDELFPDSQFHGG